MTTLFLSWQDPKSRRWFPIGKLQSNSKRFVFVYTNGVLKAMSLADFKPLAAFPELNKVYTASELFPLFSNRLVPSSRPDYQSYLRWLAVPESEQDPVVILARSGGQRATDTLEILPFPERLESGIYTLLFLAHGLSHMPPESAARVERLSPGERLLLMEDFQNPHDKNALALRTSEQFPKDMHIVGYLPRYLKDDFGERLKTADEATVTVERVNSVPAPIQFRLLCRLTARWPNEFVPFSSSDYEPLAREETVANSMR